MSNKTLALIMGGLIFFLLLGAALSAGIIFYTLDKYGREAEFDHIRKQLKAYTEHEQEKFKLECDRTERLNERNKARKGD